MGIGDWRLEIGDRDRDGDGDWFGRVVGHGGWILSWVGVRCLAVGRGIAGRVIWFGRVLSGLGSCNAQGSAGDATLVLDATL